MEEIMAEKKKILLVEDGSKVRVSKKTNEEIEA